MNAFGDRLWIFVLAAIVGVVIKAATVGVRYWLNIQNYPTDERKRNLLDAVVRMRRAGETYRRRLAYLQGQGLRKDVAEEIIAEAEGIIDA